MEKLLRVGTLAKRTGVSIRTLHYYDAIGLLSPPTRTETGHRLYTAADVARLQQIRALQHLGFSLDEVRTCLADPGMPAERVLNMQLESLRTQMDRLQEICRRVEGLRRWLARGQDPSMEELLTTLEVMTSVERYYTPEQLEELKQRREQVGEARVKEVEVEWPRLIAEMKAAMDAGTDPASSQVQDLTRRWQGLVEEFTGGNSDIAASLRRMYESEAAVRDRAGVDMALFEYVNRAIAAGR